MHPIQSRLNVLDTRIYWEQQRQGRLDKQLKEAHRSNQQLRVLLNCMMRVNNFWYLLNINYLRILSHLQSFDSIESLLFLLLGLFLPLSIYPIGLRLLFVPLALPDLPCRRYYRALLEGVNSFLLLRDPLLYHWHLIFTCFWHNSCCRSFFSINFLYYHSWLLDWLLGLVMGIHQLKLILWMLSLQILRRSTCLHQTHCLFKWW